MQWSRSVSLRDFEWGREAVSVGSAFMVPHAYWSLHAKLSDPLQVRLSRRRTSFQVNTSMCVASHAVKDSKAR